MAQSTINSLVLLAAAAVLAPLLAHRIAKWLLVPSVVLEIALGVLLGPQVLRWAAEDDVVNALSQIGLATLMCMAGYEIDFATVRGKPLRLATIGWFISLALGLAVAALIHGFDLATIVIGLCLTTTALGTILPILQDSGVLKTPFGLPRAATRRAGSADVPAQ